MHGRAHGDVGQRERAPWKDRGVWSGRDDVAGREARRCQDVRPAVGGDESGLAREREAGVSSLSLLPRRLLCSPPPPLTLVLVAVKVSQLLVAAVVVVVVVKRVFVLVLVPSAFAASSDRLHQSDVGRPPGVILEPLDRSPIRRKREKLGWR